MAGRIARETWLRFVAHVNANMPLSTAAERCGMDYAAAQRFCRGDPVSSGHAIWLELCDGEPLWEQYKAHGLAKMVAPPKGVTPTEPDLYGIKGLSDQPPEVRDALASGRVFRERYFGRSSLYAQELLWDELWNRFLLGRETGERQFVVVNFPPGFGKSVLLHDLICRMIVEDRGIRLANFSVSSNLAIKNTAEVRRTLERAQPVRVREIERKRGSRDALSTLSLDFGGFKPLNRDVWTKEAFIVAQADDEVISAKEPTLAAFGFDQSYIGNRLDGILADDMVDKRFTRNPDRMMDQRKIWDDETETRLEPGGLLALVGQRLAADDLYRYCIDQTIPLDEWEMEELNVSEEPKRYSHIVYPAHDEAKCAGDHGREAKAWPDGCLLNPKRLPWKDLKAVQRKNPETFEIVFQQRDSAPGSTLVHPAWVNGGVDHLGDHHAPAWDSDRSVWQRPTPLPDDGPSTGIITVDPSSTRFWAVQAWNYTQPGDEQAAKDLAGRRSLLDLSNLKMEAPELLGYSLETRTFYGLLEQWYQNFQDCGLRLHVVVVEQNHAQRFLMQYDHARTWSKLRGVQFVPHNTASNKLDPEIGVTSIGEHWRFGRVRLPGKTEADRMAMDPLVRQVTTWPRATLDDQVMANWFMEHQLPNIAQRVRRAGPETEGRRRPSWLAGAKR